MFDRGVVRHTGCRPDGSRDAVKAADRRFVARVRENALGDCRQATRRRSEGPGRSGARDARGVQES